MSSTPVSAKEAKSAFKNAIILTCEANGVDTRNGFGTTDECFNNFETFASDHCFNKLTDFDNKIYTSKFALIADFHVFDSCAMDIIWLKFNAK